MRTPGSCVWMTPNGPRFSSGRSGLGSQVSIWLGPPAIHSRMTLLRRCRRPARAVAAGAPQQVRQREPGDAGQAGLEHVAAAEEREAFLDVRG